MKIKQVLFIGLILLVTFLIYLTTLDKKVYYLALGDSLAAGVTPYGGEDYGYTDYISDYLSSKRLLEDYISEYAVSGYRITDLLRDISDNKEIAHNRKKKTLKNALIKADLVTLSIGADDFYSRLSVHQNATTLDSQKLKQYIDQLCKDMDQLLSVMREYCKEDILLIGYYNPNPSLEGNKINEIIAYANSQMEKIAKKYEVTFVQISDLFQGHREYLPNPLDMHPSKQGYRAISREIEQILQNGMLKK